MIQHLWKLERKSFFSYIKGIKHDTCYNVGETPKHAK